MLSMRWQLKKYFYPRPPRGGRRSFAAGVRLYFDFYPRPPRGGRPGPTGCRTPRRYFYPRPPRGGRRFEFTCKACNKLFLPTPSTRRATVVAPIIHPLPVISTHALHEEGDAAASLPGAASAKFLPTPSTRRATSSSIFCYYLKIYFYPRPPRGGRQQM